MREVRNDCVGCDLPCIHYACPYYGDRVVYACDECGAESDETTIFEDDGKHYCTKCMLLAHMSDFVDEMTNEYGAEWVKDNFMEVEE